MDIQIEKTNAQLEESLAALTPLLGEDVVSQIRPILSKNLTLHRIEIFIEKDSSNLDDYIKLVAENFLRWHNYLEEIQTKRSSLVWNELYQNLISSAFHYFLHKNFDYSVNTHEFAEECASNAAVAILDAHFPYDTDFDAWVAKIVQNTCLKFMRTSLRKKEIPAEKIVDLDEKLENTLEGMGNHLQMQDEGLCQILMDAIAQLSQSRRQVIELKYFYEYPPNEIAKKIGKSIDAVYCLQFNALQDLRKILTKTGISING